MEDGVGPRYGTYGFDNTALFPYVGDDKRQIVDNMDDPVQQTVFTLQGDGILVEMLPDGGWAAGFYARQ